MRRPQINPYPTQLHTSVFDPDSKINIGDDFKCRGLSPSIINPKAGHIARRFIFESYPIEGNESKNTVLDIGLKIDGEYPFAAAQDITLDRYWKDEREVTSH